jgi:hypothetical protein
MSLYKFKSFVYDYFKTQLEKVKHQTMTNTYWYHSSYAIQYSTVQYSTVQYSTVQYSTVQYNTIQYNTIQYNTILLYVPKSDESSSSSITAAYPKRLDFGSIKTNQHVLLSLIVMTFQ